MKTLSLGFALIFVSFAVQAQKISNVTRRTIQTARPEGYDQTFSTGQSAPPATQVVVVRVPSEEEKAALVQRTVLFQKKRAEEGSAISQFDLGVRYLDGDGVHQNRQKALYWLRRSAAADYTPAKNKLAKLGESEKAVPAQVSESEGPK